MTLDDIGFHTEQSCVAVNNMSVGPKSNTGPALLQRKPRRRRGKVPNGGKAFLGARDRELHNQLKKDGSLKSGRAGAYIYYVRKGRQCWRRCVVPHDPRSSACGRVSAPLQRGGALMERWQTNAPRLVHARDQNPEPHTAQTTKGGPNEMLRPPTATAD
jgi:hypothetical protein